MAEKGLAFLIRAPGTGITSTVSTSTDLVTSTGHGLADGAAVFFTTTGTLPALTAGTFTPNKTYYVGNSLTNTYSLHPTKGNGIAGTSGLDFTDTGSGTHTMQPLTTIAGLNSNTLAINGQSVDVTTKDSTGQWREFLAGAGTVSMSVSGSGTFQDDSNVIQLRADAITRTVKTYSLVFESGDEYYGLFQVTSIEQGGDHDGAVTYNVSLESAGPVTLITNI